MHAAANELVNLLYTYRNIGPTASMAIPLPSLGHLCMFTLELTEQVL